MNKINIKTAFDYHYYLDDQMVVFLTAIVLYSGGEINRQRMLAMFKKMNSEQPFAPVTKENFLGKRNLYHWKSNNINEWFSDENMLTIYRELLDNNQTAKNYEFSMDELLTYSNLALGKTRNYCLDWLHSNLFARLLERDQYSFNCLSFPVKVKPVYDFDVTGYCCEDCDGDYEQYKAYRYENQILKQAVKDVHNYFNSLKRYKTNDPILLKTLQDKGKKL